MQPNSVRRPSGSMAAVRPLYDELTDLLVRHVSRITVTSMLGSTLAQRSIAPYDVRADNIVDLIEELMVGLRLFCDPEKLPDLMIELAEFCDRALYASMAPLSSRSATLPKANPPR